MNQWSLSDVALLTWRILALLRVVAQNTQNARQSLLKSGLKHDLFALCGGWFKIDCVTE